MEMHAAGVPEKKPDEAPGRLHRDDAGSFVMPEKRRVMSDYAGWHGGALGVDKKTGR
jgi:hypothetical protein